MKIWIHRYELVPKDKAMKTRPGALLKVEWAMNHIGFSDLHPYPEYNEPELDAHIESLRDLSFTTLAEDAMEFSYVDCEHRLQKRNVFAGLILPRNHHLVPRFSDLTPEYLKALPGRGFSHLKVKAGENFAAEMEKLPDFIEGTPSLTWRLDFNSKVAGKDVAAWWESFDPYLKKHIDFVEDPVSSGQIEIAGPWADDWARQERARIRIIKPVREAVEDLGKYDRIVFTHSLDHPLGQASAVWAASRFYARHPRKTEVCGLSGADVYEPNEFSKVWFCDGPRLKPTSGFGFGFGEILESLAWQRVL